MSLPARPSWIPRRGDQLAIALIVVASLVGMLGWWIAAGGLSGQLTEVDRSPKLTAQFQADLNTADWPELAQLPGVGPALAKRIIESRKVEGPFPTVDSLDRVRGVGPRTLERLRPYLIASPNPSHK
jgi:competence protein ComEA